MITWNGKSYRLRKETTPPFNLSSRLYDHVGDVQHANQKCPVLMARDRLYLKVQPPKSQWPDLYLMKTEAEILEGWL